MKAEEWRMNYEMVKTILLSILVGLSLLLTYGLWSYQPDFDQYKTEMEYVNEANLGGELASKKSIIKPNQVIFHINNAYFGFDHPSNRRSLFQEMQEWEMENLSISEDETLSAEEKTVEVTFPEKLPMSIIDSIFTLDIPDDSLPTWSFKRVIFTLDEENSNVQANFLSVDRRKQAMFTIEDSKAFETLSKQMRERTDLIEYTLFDEVSSQIFLPADTIDMRKETLTIERIEPSILVDALFRDPSLVSPNVNEAYFTDGQRGMRIYHNENSMEYINPMQSNYDRMDIDRLLDESIEDINDHQGWTEDYYLDAIDPAINQVVYRMHYDEYPIFHHGHLSKIEQQWRDNELHIYRRPLLSLTNSFGGGHVKLPSGHEIIEYLSSTSSYDLEKIEDIQIGYYLSYADDEAYSIHLEPVWSMNYNGSWQVIRSTDAYFDEGGEQTNAMETN